MSAPRKHLVESAGYWFRASREHQRAGLMANALFAMENAYNHVENALAASRDALEAFREADASGSFAHMSHAKAQIYAALETARKAGAK